MHLLTVGTYPTGGGPGTGEGIWSLPIDTSTGALGAPALLAEAASPSFLAPAPSGAHVYAVSEQTVGGVAAFRSPESGTPALVAAGRASSAGADPCHVVAHADALWVSNYSSGTFTVVPLGPGGDLDPQVPSQTFEHSGSGPVLDRQEGPHAHSSLATPCGRFAWVMDLGTDEVRRYRRRDEGALLDADGIAVTFPAGTGPRHAAVHPSGTVFVVGELDNSVHVVRTDPGTGGGVPVASVPACLTPSREGVVPLPSHVALSADGTRLYVGVRGPDVVATFAVREGTGRGGQDGAAGESTQVTLEHLADTSVSGVWPRHFAVLAGDDGADLVVVANQESSTVVALRIDPVTGAGAAVDQVTVPAPACIVA